jgi:hypothetical protein
VTRVRRYMSCAGRARKDSKICRVTTPLTEESGFFEHACLPPTTFRSTGSSGPAGLATGDRAPSLLDLDPQFGDLRTTVDFRRIHATILRRLARPAIEASSASRYEKNSPVGDVLP